jgi:aspartyl-tRNA(Asn)/glutamyl-tRNA(Gln) amidotransferase subunit A
VLLVPTAPIRATPIGAAIVDNTAVRPALLSMCLPFNMMGLPAVSIPGPVADHGLPIGVQIVGTTLDERRLLSVTAAVEERLRRPPTRLRS